MFLWVRKSWLGNWAVLRMLSLFETCLGLQDLLPRWHTHRVGSTVPAVDGRPQFLCRWAFYSTAWVSSYDGWSPSEQSTQKSKAETTQHPLWLSLKSYTVTAPPDVEHRDCPRSVREEITGRLTHREEGIISRGKDLWGSSWRLETMLLLPLYLWWAEEWPPKDSRFSFWNQCHLTWKKDLCRCDEVKNIEVEDYPGLSRRALNTITVIL